MILEIVFAYDKIEKFHPLWAKEEHGIDFRSPAEQDRALRCTGSYAITELKYFLAKSDPDMILKVCSAPSGENRFIQLEVVPQDDGDGFDLIPSGKGVIARGHSRNGLLSAVYELLRLRGWRFMDVGLYGESAPLDDRWDLPETPQHFKPSFKYRMIDQYRDSDDSIEYLKFLSRQRVNVVFRKPAGGKFADKLGMRSRTGGHLLTKIMDPDQILEDGRTLWEAHSHWYGLPAEGCREKSKALRIQLCMANEELMEYICKRVYDLLAPGGSMEGIDILDLWGFDTWGQNCNCEQCRDMGNGADQNLYLLSRIRQYLTSHLPRRVWLNTISYEGTVTMDPPSKKVPQELVDAEDFVIFYPIRRCYMHSLKDETCQPNERYRKSLCGWQAQGKGIALWEGEYYNVSYFEDLPLVFDDLIPGDMRYYYERGCSGATFMHNFAPTSWGVRAITQLQHTQYAWNIDTDDNAFLEEYFVRRYPSHADAMRIVYEKIREVSRYVSAWRNYDVGAKYFFSWDPWTGGNKPSKEISIPHFPDTKSFLDSVRKGKVLIDEAFERITEEIRLERSLNWKKARGIYPLPNTPLEIEAARYYDKVEHRMEEDRRGILYFKETLALLEAFTSYYYARLRDLPGEEYWEQVEEIADRLSRMWQPLSYANPGPGIDCQDALTRTQLRMTLSYIRGVRALEKE